MLCKAPPKRGCAPGALKSSKLAEIKSVFFHFDFERRNLGGLPLPPPAPVSLPFSLLQHYHPLLYTSNHVHWCVPIRRSLSAFRADPLLNSRPRHVLARLPPLSQPPPLLLIPLPLHSCWRKDWRKGRKGRQGRQGWRRPQVPVDPLAEGWTPGKVASPRLLPSLRRVRSRWSARSGSCCPGRGAHAEARTCLSACPSLLFFLATPLRHRSKPDASSHSALDTIFSPFLTHWTLDPRRSRARLGSKRVVVGPSHSS